MQKLEEELASGDAIRSERVRAGKWGVVDRDTHTPTIATGQKNEQMGVFEEKRIPGPTMHWQSERSSCYLGGSAGVGGTGTAYDPSRDLSPNLPGAPASPPCCPPPPAACCAPTASSTPPPDHCAGCGGRIRDRFYLQAVERRWHAPCLRCCECKHPLDTEATCFARDGNIFCKKDYYRLFAMRRCARCQAAISSSELVMRARELVFHVRCFTCALCSTALNKGDTFGMRDSAVYCRLHYETMPEYPLPHHIGGPPPSLCPGGPLNLYHQPGPPHFPRGPYASSPDYAELSPAPRPTALDSPVKGGGPFFNGGGGAAPPRQKGRPRKKKPKDLEAMTANLDLNTEYMDMGFSRSGGLGGSSRTKRMRTSFKHHQLRTMKSYFAINHNPDAKDLKQLSQKTGLPKRVLQVWFQNARAKWRRLMTKQEGKLGMDKCSADGSLELDSLYGHGPASMAGSVQSLPPHSPPYGMQGNSPSSLDCA